MADYIYLLETRLSPAQQKAIGTIRTIARENDVTLFLTGGAVRDLTGGGSIRDLDLTVQGTVLPLKSSLEGAGAEVYGEHAEAQRLFLVMPGGVRVELSSAVNVTYPQPGKPKVEAGTLSDDLRCRDFTANAMAISLNDGSYGLLMDPLNGVADIENRELRLVSNYGFIQDPSRLIRAARLSSRLGWHMEERTRQRYDTAKEEGYISSLAAWNRGYELEEIFHEEDPVRILRALEAEGWMAALFPPLASSKANTAALADLAERQGQLQTQGILAQSAALQFPLVTAKMVPADVASLKGMLVRPGFVREIEGLEGHTRDFATRFASKEAATPSAAWKLLHGTDPNLVLSLAYTGKAALPQSRLKTFLTESPAARQRVPYALMQEMRINPDLPGYAELVDKLFFELMDGKLSTPEEIKAYLEPYSPPAPPPPVNLRRARAKKEARPSRAKGKKVVEIDDASAPDTVAAAEEADGLASGLTDDGTLTGPDRGTEPTPKVPLEGKVAPEAVKVRSKKSVAAIVEPVSVKAESKLKADLPPSIQPKAAGKSKEPQAALPKSKSEPMPVAPSAGKSVPTAAAQAKSAGSKAPAKTPVSTRKVPAKNAVPSAKKVVVVVNTPPAKPAIAAKKAASAALNAVPAAPSTARKTTPARTAPTKSAAGKAGVLEKKAAGKKIPAKKKAGRR